MEKIVLRHLVEKKMEGNYYTIPFSVPDGVNAITVAYTYPRNGNEKNIIDLGLEDAEGCFLGWSGSSRSKVTVGEFCSTPGYLMEPVKAGEWKIIVGAYHISEEGVPVIYEITLEENKARWFYGDLHVHSDASDGQHSIYELAKMAKKIGLDFLAVTNHNNYAENFCLPKVPGLTLIPGVEWTHYLGHMNFLGIRQPFTGSFIANDKSQMQRITREAREHHALVSVNHPKCPVCPYLWEDDACFQSMEIWNGPMRKANRDAIQWWTELLSKGRRIPAVGGSDYHRDREFVKMANPVTAVYAASPSAEDLMDAVEHGHCYVVNRLHGVKMEMHCGEKMFGDMVSDGKRTHTLSIRVENMPRWSCLQIISEKGIIQKINSEAGKINCEVQVGDIKFVYLLAQRKIFPGKNRIIAVSNPIYFVR